MVRIIFDEILILHVSVRQLPLICRRLHHLLCSNLLRVANCIVKGGVNVRDGLILYLRYHNQLLDRATNWLLPEIVGIQRIFCLLFVIKSSLLFLKEQFIAHLLVLDECHLIRCVSDRYLRSTQWVRVQHLEALGKLISFSILELFGLLANGLNLLSTILLIMSS